MVRCDLIGPPASELARAKLNLYLHVVGRRADGYHLLDSLVAFAEIGDRVSVARAADLSLDVGGPFALQLPSDVEQNLVLRSARWLAERSGIADGAAIALDKQLPVASGIGGGSSDSAAALRALARLWRCDLDRLDPADVAHALGADVPVCLINRAAWVGGIGEAVTPATSLPDCWVVLANPGVAVATPAVFKARRGEFSTPARFGAVADAAALAFALSQRRNDLTEAALSLAPEIGEVLRALSAEPAALLARMSGSGATCFALFAAPGDATAAAARLAAAHPRWWVGQGKLR
jgi:4-diphosphocytidyl-2-C-methyl-D-erythritol kinase